MNDNQEEYEPVVKSMPKFNEIKLGIDENGEEDSTDLSTKPSRLPSYLKQHGTQHPFDNSNAFVRLVHYVTHDWFYSIVKLGYKKDLEAEDCYDVPIVDSTNENSKLWIKYMNERKQKDLSVNTASIIWKIEKKSILDRFFWATVVKLSQLSVPFLISELTGFFGDETQPFKYGIYYSLLLLLAGFFNTLTFNYAFTSAICSLSRIRSYLILMIYQKSLSLSLSSSESDKDTKSTTMGQKLTMIAADTRSIAFFVGYFPIMLANLVLTISVVIFLYLEVGAAALFGWLFMMIIGGPIQFKVGKKIVNATRKYLKASDTRVKFITELIQGIRITKMYTWEYPLMDQVGIYRNEEAKRLLIRVKYMALMTMMNISTPQFMALILFAVYIALGNTLTLKKTFTVISLIQLLRISIKIIPFAAMLFIGSYVGCNRLNNLFSSTEQSTLMINNEFNDKKENENDMDDIMISMTNAYFRWNAHDNLNTNDEELKSNEKGSVSKSQIKLAITNKKGDDPDTLKELTFKINKGKLVAIVGSVGSGKSSLIAAILGEIKLIKGSSYCACNSIGYVSQQSFIINGTVRCNILFGLRYNKTFYEHVIEASALSSDLTILADGDLTEIGERGINLSGGQKQRISFARALYRSKYDNFDLYLFDDSLSAVDVDVGSVMFHEGICNVLKNKTRLIVMNSHLDLLQYCDEIIVIDDGVIVAHDIYQNVIENIQYQHILPKKDESRKKPQLQIQKTISLRKNYSYNPDKCIRTQEKIFKGKLIIDEDRSTKSIPLSLYAKYFSAAGSVFDYRNLKYKKNGQISNNESNSFGLIMVIIEILLLVFAQAFDTSSDVWLSFWSEESEQNRFPDKNDTFWLIIWSIFILCLSASSFASSFFFGYLSTKAAMNVHSKTLFSVLRAPILYFASTPTGRIINRFSKDTNEMDDQLQINFNNFAQGALQIIGYLVLIIYAVPYTLGLLIFLIPIFYVLQKYFRRTSRSLKRLDQITFSPILTQFSESLLGLDTIRSYGLSQYFLNKFREKVDKNHRVFLSENISSRWFASNMDVLINFLLLMVSLFSCWMSRSSSLRNSFDISLLSLSLVYSYSLTTTMKWSMRAFVDVEKNFTAVERLLYYQNNTPSESNSININYRPPVNQQWPMNGQLTIRNLKMRYRKDLDLVLNDINAVIKAGEKVGICGRTGSGKSSLLLTLFRLVEPEISSIIEIDGINCLKLGLQDLRKNLSIIPQDPLLFSGTIKFNLDPFNNYNDNQIWDILKKIKLYNFINEKKEKLLYFVSENGSNFSQGQKQLICIGRALLKQTKLLLLDEATSSIDKYTDKLIQNLIRKEFNDRTVLCIAHRINTIIDYDRIMVLSKGNIVEFDKPQILLKNKNGIFSSMVADLISTNHDDQNEIFS